MSESNRRIWDRMVYLSGDENAEDAIFGAQTCPRCDALCWWDQDHFCNEGNWKKERCSKCNTWNHIGIACKCRRGPEINE